MPFRYEAIWRRSTVLSVGCLVAVSTCVSALGQTPAPELHAAEEPPVAGAPSNAHIGCTELVGREPASADEHRQLARQCVTEKLAVWQQRLKLEEWRISIAMTHRGDLKPK